MSDVGSAAADDYKTTLPPLPELCVEKVEAQRRKLEKHWGGLGSLFTSCCEELVKPQAEPPKDATDKVRSLVRGLSLQSLDRPCSLVRSVFSSNLEALAEDGNAVNQRE